jgi:G3E family GTPase
MEQMDTIPVYLVCGFFGAGKTTFLKNLYDESGDSGKGKIAFLVNEYGNSRIDGMRIDDGFANITGIDGGSIFCNCRHWDFIKALKQLALTTASIIIIESPGFADPSPLADDITIVNRLTGNNLEYRGNVCMVDATSFLDQLDMFEAVQRQVKSAGVVVINKTDLTSTSMIEIIKEKISDIAYRAMIFTTIQARLPFDRVEHFLVRAFPAPSMEGIKTSENRPLLCLLMATVPVDAGGLRAFLEGLLGQVLRVKGDCLLDQGWHDVDVAGKDVNIVPSEIVANQTELLVILTPGSTENSEIEARWHALVARRSISPDS